MTILSGANLMASVVITLYFLRFWRQTSDRFFLFFAASFAIEGVDRAVTAVMADHTPPRFYVVRLISFLLIIVAILNKNRR